VYLFHELPENVRRKAAAEMARVCKPGGLVVRFTDLLFPHACVSHWLLKSCLSFTCASRSACASGSASSKSRHKAEPSQRQSPSRAISSFCRC